MSTTLPPAVFEAVLEMWAEPDLTDYNAFCAKYPLQPKQEIAEKLSHECDALLYGGAAGGGKSMWLLIHMGRQMLKYPGNRGAIFRRVFPSLNRTIIPRARLLYKGYAEYNKVEHTFYFHNGSILELGTLQYKDSVDDYQGAEYGAIAFEEITEFLEGQVDYFKTRLRAPVDGPKPHLIATTNPGGVGHKWVKREWVKPKEGDYVGSPMRPMKVWKAKPKGEEPPQKRAFVPATLEDNPILLDRDPTYRDRLRSIKDPKKRKAYEKGDWDAIEEVDGALWTQKCFDDGRRQSHPTVNRRVMSLDPSSGTKDLEEIDKKKSDGFGVTVGVLGEDNHAYVTLSEEWHQPVHIMAAKVIKLYWELDVDKIVIEANHGGKWIPALLKTLDPRLNIELVWASDGKMTRASSPSALFYDQFGFPATAHLVGVHPQLEDECTNYTGKPGEASPDMLDSMVWLIWDLLLGDTPGDIDLETHAGTSITGSLMEELW